MKISRWAAAASAIGLAGVLAACSSTAHPAASATAPSARPTTASTALASSAPASPATASSATASSATASPASASSAPAGPTATATSVPAGYQRVGTSAQGVTFAVPSSWVVVNLAKETMQQAAQRAGLKGISSAQALQDMQSIYKLHGLVVFDVKSADDSTQHFATNVNAYCVASGVTETGSSGVSLLRQSTVAELQKIDAGHITSQDATIGAIPGLRTSYTLSSSSMGTLRGGQLEVLPTADRACFVTLTALENDFPSAVLSEIAASAVFP